MANDTIDGNELVRLYNKAVKDRAALLEALRDMVCKTCEHPWCDRARQIIQGIN